MSKALLERTVYASRLKQRVFISRTEEIAGLTKARLGGGHLNGSSKLSACTKKHLLVSERPAADGGQ